MFDMTKHKDKILSLRAEGKTYNEIAAITGASKGTIAYHCKGTTIIKEVKGKKETFPKKPVAVIVGICDFCGFDYKKQTRNQKSKFCSRLCRDSFSLYLRKVEFDLSGKVARQKCSKCNIVKERSEYHLRDSKTGDLQQRCKLCARESVNKWREDNPERWEEYWRANYTSPEYTFTRRALKYGLTPEELTGMIEKSGGVCAICQDPPSETGLVVDHCHTTGAVRGLLCGNCNTGLGLFKDDIDTLDKAIEYLLP